MKMFFPCFAAVACTVAIIRSQLSAAASIRPASSVTPSASTGSWSTSSSGLLSSFLRRPQASRTEADHEVARPVSYAKGADYGEDSDGGAEGNVWRMGAAAPTVVDGDAERKETIQMRAPLSFLATEIRDTRVKWHGVPLEKEEEREESEDEEEDGEDSSDDVDTDETDKNIGVALLQQTPTTSTTVSVSVTRGQVCTALGGLYNAALNICCLASCGTCGGTGCETRPGGAAGCCSGGIQNGKRVCSKDTAPCVPDTDAIVTTRNFTSPTQFCAWRGGIYSSFGKSCCPASCGVCGGSTCSTAPGGYNSCCTGAVGASGSCLYNAPPCVVDVVPTGIPARVSRAFADYNSRPCIEGFCNHLGGTLSADGQFCCPAGCGTCGGVAANRAGCADRPLGATMCCPQASLVARCALGGTLPCLADSTPANFTSTTSTTTLAAAAFSSTTTTTTTTSTTTTTMGAAQQAVWNNQILMEHNKLRQSAGVGALTWDATLTNFINNYLVYKAQTGCVMEHSPQANRTQIGSYSYVGENLYTVWGSPDAPNGTHVTDMWYNELYCYQYGTVGAECTKAYTDKCGQYYSYFSPTFMMVGHFTQVMWDTTTHMGCSVVQCPSGIQFLAGCSYGSNRVGWGGNVYGMLPFSSTVARQMGITNTTVCG